MTARFEGYTFGFTFHSGSRKMIPFYQCTISNAHSYQQPHAAKLRDVDVNSETLGSSFDRLTRDTKLRTKFSLFTAGFFFFSNLLPKVKPALLTQACVSSSALNSAGGEPQNNMDYTVTQAHVLKSQTTMFNLIWASQGFSFTLSERLLVTLSLPSPSCLLLHSSAPCCIREGWCDSS